MVTECPELGRPRCDGGPTSARGGGRGGGRARGTEAKGLEPNEESSDALGSKHFRYDIPIEIRHANIIAIDHKFNMFYIILGQPLYDYIPHGS